MTRLYAVQTGETIWAQQARMDSLAGVPLSEAGVENVRQISKALVPHEPTVIYAPSGEAEQQTAKLLSKGLGLKIRGEDRLVEIDYGLWQGLAYQEIKRRQPRLHKQWLEEPASVRPPGGETLAEARQRISAALDDIVKKECNGGPIIVLRPVVMGLLRCCLENFPIDDIWNYAATDFVWAGYTLDDKTGAWSS